MSILTEESSVNKGSIIMSFDWYKLYPIPPLPEQRRIAEILSTVDRKLERVKKELMNELLTGRKRVKVN